MTAARWDITIEQGASFNETLTYTDPTGALINLTGCTAHMQVRAAFGASPALVDLTTGNGGIVLGGPAGTIQVIMTSTQTAGISIAGLGGTPGQKQAVHDFFLTWPDGHIDRLWEGIAYVNPPVTQ
jgi:hypothetical protein